jgi:alpha 1,2-mannosyltransferase
MMTQIRYVFLALAVLISLHYILSFTNESYNHATSFSHLKEPFEGSANVDSAPYKTPVSDDYYTGKNTSIPSPIGRKANAVFVLLGAWYWLRLWRYSLTAM